MKKNLWIVLVLLLGFMLVACGGTDDEEPVNEPDSVETDEDDDAHTRRELIVTILEVVEVAEDGSDEEPHILVDSEEGPLRFNHSHLPDIGYTVGDTVSIVTEGFIAQSYPGQVYVSEWSLVE